MRRAELDPMPEIGRLNSGTKDLTAPVPNGARPVISDPLSPFTAATRHWFEASFAGATRIQNEGWARIRTGDNALLVAPTGSGKTLAAFLWALDSVLRLPPDAPPGPRVVYVSPLKALAYDVERNLRAPLVGIRNAARELGAACRDVRVDVRTGDTPQKDRQRQLKHPAEILVTTPESLFLLLGSRASANLEHVHTVIVDEVHALAPTKRGVHLALSLERLAAVTGTDPQRIGLSATIRPADEAARFLAGDRQCIVVDAGEPPRLALEVALPDPDLAAAANAARAETEDGADDESERTEGVSVLGERFQAPVVRDAPNGSAPALHADILARIRAHRSTIVFTNSRAQCERMAQRLNDLAGEELVRAHHGSVSHAQRREIEEALKRGDVRGIVATSSLELGVDMGAVDLVVMVESPGSVARGLQRVGRAGHQVGATSGGVLFPKLRGDLLECAVVANRMRTGELEAIRVPMRCLDILAQQIVAIVCAGVRDVDRVEAIVRRAHPYRDLSRSLFAGVLDMLSGRYPSDELADLRPRLAWDRTQNRLQPRRGTAMISRLNAGTIPDRGLFGVHLGEGGPRIGELDEEMVFETRAGDVVMLGTSAWRVLEITRDRVLVEPAPGQAGKLPFWRGDGLGRPIELGRAMGELLRHTETIADDRLEEHLREFAPLDGPAARKLRDYIVEQRTHSGVVPTDRRIVVERFRDEVGDWRICILTPFGARVHAPWAMALQTTLAQKRGFEVVATYNDDGIVLTFADSEEPPAVDELFLPPDDVEDLVAGQLDGSALFGAAFRENAARALLMPRRNPRARTPLWAQRLKAKNLMASVLQHADFPIVLETYRHCMSDVFDIPSLASLMREIRDRSIQVEQVETPRASPFASSLVFAHVASYLYEHDAPLAERRTHALTLDRALLHELLGETALRELLSPEQFDLVEAELQALTPDRHARDADELHDLLRRLGAMTVEELRARCEGDVEAWLDQLGHERRAIRMTIDGRARHAAAQDAGLYRDALGIVTPAGLPAEFLAPVDDALPTLVRRLARNRGPFSTAEMAASLGLGEAMLVPVLEALERDGALTLGQLRRTEPEWCDAEVLRRVKRQTLSRMRREIAPVDDATLGRFLIGWHGFGAPASNPTSRLLGCIAQLQGHALPWSEWESSVLPARVPTFTSEMFDLLSATGQIVWIGRGSLGPTDGRVAIYRRDALPFLEHPPATPDDLEPLPAAILRTLEARGADFTIGLRAAVRRQESEPPLPPFEDADFDRALWDLVWRGLVTNDTFAPLRTQGVTLRRSRAGRRPRPLRADLQPGRWSLVRMLTSTVTPTEQLHARAAMLLERYGVVSRAAAHAEELAGGFSQIYAVLKTMEETGRARRGHFVDGLEGAQFALPGAVDRLRSLREQEATRDVRILAAVDPANPWGALLPWPETAPEAGRPRRAAGARVVLVDGALACFVAANGHALLTFGRENRLALRAALTALATAPRRRMLVVETVDGVTPERSELRELLEQSGFGSSYRGWTARENARGA